MASSQSEYVNIAVRIDSESQKQLEIIAYQKSEPGDHETVSSVTREAIREYIDGHDNDE